MHAGRGAARLLLAAAFAVTVTGRAREPRSEPAKVYQPNKNALQLLKHVMLHEEEWTDVLQEPVMKLGKPPHEGRAFIAPALGPLSSVRTEPYNKEPVYDVHDLVATVINHYSNIRSFIEYGAKALRQALACYTFKQVHFQSKGMSMLMSKDAEAVILLQAANDLKKDTSKFIDIMSSVHNDNLTLLLSAYWKVIKHLQYEGVQHMDKPPYPKAVKDVMEKLYKNIELYLRNHCLPYQSDTDLYEMTGISRRTPIIKDPSLQIMISSSDLEQIMSEQAAYMARVARRIGNVGLTDHSWASLFLYRDRPWPDSAALNAENRNESQATPETSKTGPSNE